MALSDNGGLEAPRLVLQGLVRNDYFPEEIIPAALLDSVRLAGRVQYPFTRSW